ncbi:glycosyltransferase family 71 protein [[Candida] arabinofermentans NRRL YB-2248]|uniref:dynamin GTPase n=1 Tax=[Candida] arabinofermentans NRRL YB-2248 TaxID=983967 RepID=A0A1E4T3T4_9ASCO|nr:glycosyltransferase family 71 protein [[Candida] arabinofermentans NRRL YB-2248]
MQLVGIRIRRNHLLIIILAIFAVSLYVIAQHPMLDPQYQNNEKLLKILKSTNSTEDMDYDSMLQSLADDHASENKKSSSSSSSGTFSNKKKNPYMYEPPAPDASGLPEVDGEIVKVELEDDALSAATSGSSKVTTAKQLEKNRASIIKAIFKMIASVKPDVNYDDRKTDRSTSPLDHDMLTENLLNEFVIFNDEFVTSYKESHAKIIELIDDLKFPKGLYKGTGIVMVGGDKYTWLTLISITLMRENGGDLPVEVIIPDRKQYEAQFCDVLLPKLNAKCVVMTDLLGENYAQEIQLNKYQFKGLSLLASSFDNLLLLDSDNIPVAPLTKELFEEEPFTDTQMVFWPDFWKRSTSPKFYDIANLVVSNTRVRDVQVDLPESQHYELRPKDAKKIIPFHDRLGAIPDKSTESGQLMISKTAHADVVLLSLYYNAYGPTGYYPLLSQGVAGEGDKDTFPAAATVLGKQFYQLKKNVGVNGLFLDGGYRGTGMIQYDPILDYQAFLEFIEVHKKSDESFDSGILDGFMDDNARKSALFLHANFPKLYPVELLNDFVIRNEDDGVKHYRMYGSDEIKGDYEYDYWKIMYDYLCVDKIDLYYTEQAVELSTPERRTEFCEGIFQGHLEPFSLLKLGSKMVKLPVYVGGGVAAAGSYVAYKVDQASSYTQDQIGNVKDAAGRVFDGINGFISGVFDGGSAGGSGGNNSSGGDGGGGLGAGSGGAAVAAVGYAHDQDDELDEKLVLDEDDDDEFEDELEGIDDGTDDAMLNLTRQMIEIRSILLNVGGSNSLKLPSIVVVGSQSSGKSSVLESIVGREFLPKGSNMVTRRPIELTLVNDTSLAAEVAEFPALKIFNMTDFHQVQKTLFDLNMAVPEDEAVSPDPIQLTIKSPKVPDLSLVDLPGYIQIEASDQPVELKNKIRQLCDRYLEEPNIILAISAADVDLANSSALRAAKRSDPRGERTIGVITKLDLVDAETARSILTNKKYPLRMGYVGVITRAPPPSSIFKRYTGTQAFIAQQNFEKGYLKEHKDSFVGTTVGTKTLKKKLMRVLEKSMAISLKPMFAQVSNELEETSYKFKVEFNDRDLSSEKYMAQTIDSLKIAIKEFSDRFGRPELRSLLRSELDQRVLDAIALRYWNKPPLPKTSATSSAMDLDEPSLADLATASPNDTYWHRKLDIATSSLTKLGVGRLATSLITDALLTEIGVLVDNTELRSHPMIKDAIRDAAISVLTAQFNSTADQVENCIKPYKYEVEVDDREWSISRHHSSMLLKEELKQCTAAYNELKKTIGGNKLKQITTYLENENNSIGEDLARENLGFSPALLLRGREAMFLRDRASLINMRLKVLQSSICKFKENKYKCPEVYMDAVAEKLTQTAVLFLNVELLSDFYYTFPRELEKKLGQGLTPEQIEAFAKEDPKVKKHIELQERKELLELALGKIEDVMALQKRIA